MANGYVVLCDPFEFANRFSVPPECDSESDPDPLFSATYASDSDLIKSLLPKLPPREADVIELYYLKKKRQADIAELFNCTQAAISYRLTRGVQRLKFIVSIPTVTEEDLRRDLSCIFDTIDVDILVGMWATTCQSEVAGKLELTQGRVRHRFFKAIEALKKAASNDEKYKPYEKIFTSISSKKFNILRSVSLPQWEHKGIDCCI